MAKRIRSRDDIYIAPKILGYYEEDQPIARDELNDTTLDPNNIDHKIIIYERQVYGWFLQPATNLLEKENCNFVVLMICLSYLEGVEQYRRGQPSNGRSSEFFRYALNRIYPNTFGDNYLNELYSEARCGLFHNGMVSGKIVLNNGYTEAIDFIGHDRININPRILLNIIKDDFNNYIEELKKINNHELRTNFNRMFTNI